MAVENKRLKKAKGTYFSEGFQSVLEIISLEKACCIKCSQIQGRSWDLVQHVQPQSVAGHQTLCKRCGTTPRIPPYSHWDLSWFFGQQETTKYYEQMTMYIYIYIHYIYIYTLCIYIYINTYILYIYIRYLHYIYIFIYIYNIRTLYIYTYIIYIHTLYIYIYIHTLYIYIFTYIIYIYIITYIIYIHTLYIFTYTIYIYIYIYDPVFRPRGPPRMGWVSR